MIIRPLAESLFADKNLHLEDSPKSIKLYSDPTEAKISTLKVSFRKTTLLVQMCRICFYLKRQKILPSNDKEQSLCVSEGFSVLLISLGRNLSSDLPDMSIVILNGLVLCIIHRAIKYIITIFNLMTVS